MITVHHYDSRTAYTNNRRLGDWVSKEIWGVAGQFENFATTEIRMDYAVIAGIVWHNYQPDCGVIELSMAAQSRRWLTRSVAIEAMRYPFEALRCQLVATRTSEHNERALRVNRWIGFEHVRIPRLRGRDEAEMIGTLTDDAWRGKVAAWGLKRH